MADKPENLMLDHLRPIRAEMARMADSMHGMRAEMTSLRQHLSGVVTLQEHELTD